MDLSDLVKKIQYLTDENSDLKHQIEMLKKNEKNSEESEDEDATLNEEADIEDFYIASKRVTDRVVMERDLARDELKKFKNESKNIIEALTSERDFFEAELFKCKIELTQKNNECNNIKENKQELVCSSEKMEAGPKVSCKEAKDRKITKTVKMPLPFPSESTKLSETTKYKLETDRDKLLDNARKQQMEDPSHPVEKMDVVEALKYALKQTENVSIKAQPTETPGKKKNKPKKMIKIEEEKNKAKLVDVPRKQKMERSLPVEKMDVIEAIQSSLKHTGNLSLKSAAIAGTPGKKRCKFPGDCTGCNQPSCENCPPCLDKPSRGGPNRLKQKCVKRKCRVGSEADSVKSGDTNLGA